jgi:hypothetical protein
LIYSATPKDEAAAIEMPSVPPLACLLFSDTSIQSDLIHKHSPGAASGRAGARKLDDLEGKFLLHDKQIANVFHAIRKILEPDVTPKRRIGFSATG